MTRFGYVMATYGAVMVTGITALFHPVPKLIWNASASVPIGLYAVYPAGALRTDELLVVTLPENAGDVPRCTALPAQRHPAPETYCSAPRADRLPHGRHDQHRRRSPSVQRSIGITWDARCPFGRAAG